MAASNKAPKLMSLCKHGLAHEVWFEAWKTATETYEILEFVYRNAVILCV
jgi:hypothetical protein